jgi:ornithine--oxo-acid transaminase
MNAIELNSLKLPSGKTAFDLCILLKNYGILCKPTHETILRLTPPLVIEKDDIVRAAAIIIACIETFISN